MQAKFKAGFFHCTT